MMEIVYKDEKKQTEDKKIDILPKNIRQIGEPDHRLRLYIESCSAHIYRKRLDISRNLIECVCFMAWRRKKTVIRFSLYRAQPG